MALGAQAGPGPRGTRLGPGLGRAGPLCICLVYYIVYLGYLLLRVLFSIVLVYYLVHFWYIIWVICGILFVIFLVYS